MPSKLAPCTVQADILASPDTEIYNHGYSEHSFVSLDLGNPVKGGYFAGFAYPGAGGGGCMVASVRR